MRGAFCGISQEDTVKQKKIIELHGDVEIGMEYGLLPFLISNEPPQRNFKTNGNFSIRLAKIPLQVNFFYSSLGTISGLNNYFHVQFDAEKYRQELKNKIKQKRIDQTNSKEKLELQRQVILKQMNYLDMIKNPEINIPRQLPVDTSSISRDLPNLDSSLSVFVDTSGMQESIESSVQDSLSQLSGSLIPSDTSKLNEAVKWSDSLQIKYQTLSSQLDNINSHLNDIEKYQQINRDSVLQKENLPSGYYPKGYSRFNKLMSYVKKFEIGTCYPNYSKFLVGNIPVRGLNIEIEKKNFFGALTYGTTLNNIFFTNNLIENNLNAQRNLYNFFDFNKVENGRKIFVFKTGYGKKESNHIFVGGLYGLGKTSYLDSTSANTETNLVLELDSKLILKKEHQFELNYGRSSIQANNINYQESSFAFNSLFNFTNKSNAILINSTHSFFKSSSIIQLTYRYIEPFFKSYGLGFIRSDNERYQIKIKQKVSKTLTAQFFYRKEQDNLLNLYSYHNVLQSYGTSLTFRPTRKLLFKADYRPIQQKTIDNAFDSITSYNKNYILNIIGNYRLRIRETYFRLTGVYSRYQLFNGLSNNSYKNINMMFTINKKAVHFSSSYNQFITTDTASIQNAKLVNVETNYNLKNVKLSAKGKLAITGSNGLNIGYGGSISVKLHKRLNWEFRGEKLVFGDFYNSLSLINYNEYPFFISTKIKITI